MNKRILTLSLVATISLMGCGEAKASTQKEVDPVKRVKTIQHNKPVVLQQSVKTEQQILAKLGYLPFNTSNGNPTWQYSVPTSLSRLWSYGENNVLTRGAVMQFQHANGLVVDGIVGSKTWEKLVYASEHNVKNPYGYSYVVVSEGRPETLTLYYNGRAVLHTFANTGIYGASTPKGTWPVYLRYYTQEMRGTNPDGSHYDDKGIPYVSYFYGGCAVHGFIRPSYGSPQSLGCVELPFDKAKIAWEYMNYGTLVTIQ